jgi:hydroxylamine reductase (hybrid-cluster protein)
MERIKKLLNELKDIKSILTVDKNNFELLDRKEEIESELKDLGFYR